MSASVVSKYSLHLVNKYVQQIIEERVIPLHNLIMLEGSESTIQQNLDLKTYVQLWDADVKRNGIEPHTRSRNRLNDDLHLMNA